MYYKEVTTHPQPKIVEPLLFYTYRSFETQVAKVPGLTVVSGAVSDV